MNKDVNVDPNTFTLRPSHKKKFKPAIVKEIVREILDQRLGNNLEYNPDTMHNMHKELCEHIRSEVCKKDFERYKIIVNCIIGEQRGEGVRVGCKCFWDSDTDNYVEETYINKNLFAVVTVFGLYQY